MDANERRRIRYLELCIEVLDMLRDSNACIAEMQAVNESVTAFQAVCHESMATGNPPAEVLPQSESCKLVKRPLPRTDTSVVATALRARQLRLRERERALAYRRYVTFGMMLEFELEYEHQDPMVRVELYWCMVQAFQGYVNAP